MRYHSRSLVKDSLQSAPHTVLIRIQPLYTVGCKSHRWFPRLQMILMRGLFLVCVYTCSHSAGVIPLEVNTAVLQVSQSRFTLASIGEELFKLIRRTACDVHCKS
jgi:hypothetical protein